MKKDIKGYVGKYCITENGEVFSIERNKKTKCNGIALLKGRKLKFNLSKGYNTIALSLESKIKRYFVHRIVYETFKGKIPKKKQINHKDGIKLNNHISNLELCTPLENTRHAWENGLCKKRFGEEVKYSKLKNRDILKIRELSKRGLKQAEIAKRFKLHPSNISYILSGKTWGHI